MEQYVQQILTSNLNISKTPWTVICELPLKLKLDSWTISAEWSPSTISSSNTSRIHIYMSFVHFVLALLLSLQQRIVLTVLGETIVVVIVYIVVISDSAAEYS